MTDTDTRTRAERAYVFDFGRVLFRWRPEVLVASVLPHRNTDADSLARWVAQIFLDGDWQAFDRGTVEPAELARRIAARSGLDEQEVLALVAACPQELQPLPDTVDWLRRLQAQGRPLHFLSNMPEPFARHFERTHDFLQAFESGVFSARVQLVKPEPEIFAHAARAYGRAPQSLLLIDDHLPNVIAARAAGWEAVHFVDAAQAEAEAVAKGW